MLLFCLVAPMPTYAAGNNGKSGTGSATQSEISKPPAIKSTRELTLSEKKGLISLKAVNVELGQILAALSKASAVPIILIDQDKVKNKTTVSFQNMTIQAAVKIVMSTMSVGGVASVGDKNGNIQAIYVITRKGENVKNWFLTVSGLVNFIKEVGSHDADCEQTYWILSSVNLGAKDWWRKTSNVEKLLDAAKNPELSTCSRMASLELYISKLSTEKLQKISPTSKYISERPVSRTHWLPD